MYLKVTVAQSPLIGSGGVSFQLMAMNNSGTSFCYINTARLALFQMKICAFLGSSDWEKALWPPIPRYFPTFLNSPSGIPEWQCCIIVGNFAKSVIFFTTPLLKMVWSKNFGNLWEKKSVLILDAFHGSESLWIDFIIKFYFQCHRRTKC